MPWCRWGWAVRFTPTAVESLIEFGEYFRFASRMLLVFGVAFEIPLFIVMLNLACVISSTVPFSMQALGVPMVLLVLISEVIARIIGRGRRKSGGGDLSEPAEDETSSLTPDDHTMLDAWDR